MAKPKPTTAARMTSTVFRTLGPFVATGVTAATIVGSAANGVSLGLDRSCTGRSRASVSDSSAATGVVSSGMADSMIRSSQLTAMSISVPGLSDLTWHEHGPARKLHASRMLSRVIPAPTSANSARPRPKIGKTIASSSVFRSGSVPSSIDTNTLSRGSLRESRNKENATFSGGPASIAPNAPYSSSASSPSTASGSSITSAMRSSSLVSRSAAAPSFLASPLSSRTHTALSPASNRSATSRRAGESSSASTSSLTSGADRRNGPGSPIDGYRTTIHGNFGGGSSKPRSTLSSSVIVSRSTTSTTMFGTGGSCISALRSRSTIAWSSADNGPR